MVTFKQIFSKGSDFFFAMRPMLIIPVWTVILLGYAKAQPIEHSLKNLLLSLFCGTALAGAVFLVNQIYDIDTDRINDKGHFLTRGVVSVANAWRLAIALDIFALVACFFISTSALMVGAFILILGMSYSVPPFRLKDRAWLALVANAVGHGTLAFLLGFAGAAGEISRGLIHSLPYLFSVAGVYVGTTIPDIDGDLRVGKRTVAVALGIEKAILLSVGCYCASLAAGLLVGDRLFLIAAAVALPGYFLMVLNGTTGATIRAVKISVLALAMVAVYCYPAYLLLLAFIIVSTRLYYWRRFALRYPSL